MEALNDEDVKRSLGFLTSQPKTIKKVHEVYSILVELLSRRPSHFRESMKLLISEKDVKDIKIALIDALAKKIMAGIKREDKLLLGGLWEKDKDSRPKIRKWIQSSKVTEKKQNKNIDNATFLLIYNSNHASSYNSAYSLGSKYRCKKQCSL